MIRRLARRWWWLVPMYVVAQLLLAPALWALNAWLWAYVAQLALSLPG